MPIYVYRCEDCSQVHEALQKIQDAPLQTCPHCGQQAMRKLIAPAGIIFKGSGFHKNDYASSSQKSKPSTSAPESKPAPSPEKKSQGTESKVA